LEERINGKRVSALLNFIIFSFYFEIRKNVIFSGKSNNILVLIERWIFEMHSRGILMNSFDK
jgi:hypothetical protein